MNSFKEYIKPESESEDISKLGILYNVHGSHAKRPSDDMSEVGIMCNEHNSHFNQEDAVKESFQIDMFGCDSTHPNAGQFEKNS